MSDNVVDGHFQHSSIDHSVFEKLGPVLAAYYRRGETPPLVYNPTSPQYSAVYDMDLLNDENILRYLLTFRATKPLFRNLASELAEPMYHLVVQNRRKTEELMATVWLLGLSTDVRLPALSIAVEPVTVTEVDATGYDYRPGQYSDSLPLTSELCVTRDIYSEPISAIDELGIGRGAIESRKDVIQALKALQLFWRKQSLNKLLANLVDYAQCTNSISGLYYEPTIGCGVLKIKHLVPFKTIPGWTGFIQSHEDRVDELLYQVEISLELYPDVYEYSFTDQLKGLHDA